MRLRKRAAPEGEEGPRREEPARAREEEGAPADAPAGRRGVAGGAGRGVRGAGAAAVGAVGSGFIILARLVLTVAVLIALLIGLAIILRDVSANASNSIVEGIHEGANFFAGSFTDLIKFSGNHPKRAISVNWGIALVVYLFVGAVIARFIAAIGRGGLGFERARRPVLR
jgi:hypothetical protein